MIRFRTPSIAYGNNVYIAWGELGLGVIELLYRRSTDEGATFESVVNLSNNDGDSYYPKIVVLENTSLWGVK